MTHDSRSEPSKVENIDGRGDAGGGKKGQTTFDLKRTSPSMPTRVTSRLRVLSWIICGGESGGIFATLLSIKGEDYFCEGGCFCCLGYRRAWGVNSD